MADLNFCRDCGAEWKSGVTTPGCTRCDQRTTSRPSAPAPEPPPPPPPPLEPVPPHRYPVWLWAFSLGVIAMGIYSLLLLPPYWRAAREMHRAEALAKAGDRTGAERQLAEVLHQSPTSKSARLDMAVLLFGNPSEADHRRALDYLTGVKLEKEDWARVSAVMPGKYRLLFQDVKDGE